MTRVERVYDSSRIFVERNQKQIHNE